jgi:cyclic beta-1,2-glucan synthetase
MSRCTFLEGRPVNAGDDSYYDLPGRSAEAASLYEHCVRAIRHGLRFGEHGLPLIGSGDWNDGMNLVGIGGKGESVWLGFFLCEVLGSSPPWRVCGATRLLRRALHGRARGCARISNAWLGRRVVPSRLLRRRYTARLGKQRRMPDGFNLAELVGALRGGRRATRSRLAMQAVDERLVRREHALIQLLDPPFDKSNLDPGYIRGYVPGVRENGGQYTHGAIWAAMAFAALGDARRAWELTDDQPGESCRCRRKAVATYKVEPYVMAADVYALKRRTPGAADGAGIRLCRLDVSADRRIPPWPQARGWTGCISRRACPRTGRHSRFTTATGRPSITSPFLRTAYWRAGRARGDDRHGRRRRTR